MGNIKSTASPLALEVSLGVGDHQEALRIGRTLVEERLAGAANIVPGVISFFWWDGELREKAESTLLLKIVPENFEAVRLRIRELHSYVLPAVKAWPVVAGDPEWVLWLRRQVSSEEPSSTVIA